jgi:dUTP pyrophosphatase
MLKKLKLKILNKSENPNPVYETEGAAGFDIAAGERIEIPARGVKLIPTGLHFILESGYEAQLRLRSSLYKSGVIMPNAPGTIDSDYRGEIKIPVRNINHFENIVFNKGDRIAQVIVQRIPRVTLEFINEEDFNEHEFKTTRGSGGFGSTGIQ